MSDNLQILISISLYLIALVGIGLLFAKRANESSENFFLGGRSIGPWVTALSAEASDMSGWLLMGLPGVAYWSGLADAFWTAIGLAVGTYINWLVVSKRLRNYSQIAGNAITLPDFFSNRYRERKQSLLLISSLFILIFFAVYVGSCFVTCGKLFVYIFEVDYRSIMIISSLFVVLYTFLGGFLAESISDLIQAIIMIFALLVTLTIAVVNAGGLGNVFENVKDIPGFFEFFSTATPITNGEGVQLVSNSAALFDQKSTYGFITVISTLAWGLGYFGMPQVLLRFMAIRKTKELRKSRIIATTWCVISLVAAISIGLVGRVLFNTELLNKASAENIFIKTTQSLTHPLIAGIILAGILAAAMSSADSYLLIASSAVSKNIYQKLLKRDATDKQVMLVSRITLLAVALFGIVIASKENSIIFKIVSFAWAGFGATFGPIMLFSLFWKRTTHAGAVAGMLSGGLMVFIWELIITPAGAKIGGLFGNILMIYELLPAFIISCLVIYVVSKLTPHPSKEIIDEFEEVKRFQD